MNRRDFIRESAKFGIYGIVSAGCAPFISCDRRSDKPNIIIATMDTCRYDRTGLSGFRAPTKKGALKTTTPYLDNLAERGIVFHTNYSQANNTWASLGSLFNSLPPSHNPRGNKTLAEILEDEGYDTFAEVSTSILSIYGYGAPLRGITKGYGKGTAPSPRYEAPTVAKRRGNKTVNSLKSRMEKQHNRRVPLFAWLHLFQPHIPYLAPGQFRIFHTEGDFDDKKVVSLTDAPNGVFKRGFLTEKRVVDLNDAYNSEVLWADSNIEDFMNWLQKKGLFDHQRDIFILTADHGEDMGEHGFCSTHVGLYNTIHTPLMFYGANLPKKDISSLTSNMDIAPTICDLVGIRKSEGWRGKSLIPLIKKGDGKLHDIVIAEDWQTGHGEPIALVNSEGFKCIYRKQLSPQKIPPKKDGFSPSGRTEYDGISRTLSWKHNPEADRIEITLDGGTKQLIFEGGKCISYKGVSDLEYRDGLCMLKIPNESEYTWNMRSAGKRSIWKVEELKDGKEIMSSEPISSAQLPTDNYLELYNLHNDPGQRHNLASLAESEEIMKEMFKHLDVSKQEEQIQGLQEEDIKKHIDPKIGEDMKALGYL